MCSRQELLTLPDQLVSELGLDIRLSMVISGLPDSECADQELVKATVQGRRPRKDSPVPREDLTMTGEAVSVCEKESLGDMETGVVGSGGSDHRDSLPLKDLCRL